MNYTAKDYEKAQNILNRVLNEHISDIAVTENDLERVRGLILKKLNDLKKTIESSEKHLGNLQFEDHHCEILKTFLVTLKNYDIRIHEVFDIWIKYHKHEMQVIDDLGKVFDKYDDD